MDELLAEIVAARSRGLNDPEAGRVVCLVRALTPAEQALRGEVSALLNAFVVAELAPATGLPLPNWQPLTEEEAIVLLVLALTDSLGRERIGLSRAVPMAQSFLALFSPGVRCYTNLTYRFPPDASDFRRGWTEHSRLREGWTAQGYPLLGGLEHGLIALDEVRIGILWVSDED